MPSLLARDLAHVAEDSVYNGQFSWDYQIRKLLYIPRDILYNLTIDTFKPFCVHLDLV